MNRRRVLHGAAALTPFIGSIGKWFRPSGTDVPNQTILDEAGDVGSPVCVGYDIDSHDVTEPGSRAESGEYGRKRHDRVGGAEVQVDEPPDGSLRRRCR